MIERRQFGGIDAMRQTDQVLTLIKQLAALPGRKSVLFLSPGVMTTGDPERLELIIDRATKAGVTFYAVDASGLSQNSPAVAGNNALSHVASVSRTQSAQSSSAGEAAEKSRQGDYQMDAVRSSGTQATMRAFSEGTGGFLIANTNDLKKPFGKLIDDMDSHYEAIYGPVTGKDDAGFRKIEVKLSHADWSVESRAGYFAMPALKGAGPLTPYEVIGLAVLNAPARPHTFEFRSAAFHLRPGAAGTQNSLNFEIPASNLQATPEPQAGRHRLHVAMVALVKDSSGVVVDKFSVDTPFFVPNQNMAAMQAMPIPFSYASDLPAGRYTLDTVVIDRESRRASTNAVAFEVPASAGVGLSSVILSLGLEPAPPQSAPTDALIYLGKRVIPSLAPMLPPDAQPFVYFSVYPDKNNAEKPKLLVEFLLGGQVAGKQVADLPAPDASGAIPMLIRAVVRPGNCEMRITAMQGTASATQSVLYTIAPKPLAGAGSAR